MRKKDIVIIDYGMGNLLSVDKAFQKLGYQTVVTRDPEVLQRAEKVVFPGVGAFGQCVLNLEKFNLRLCIQDVIKRKVPFLGICLGLQLLFDSSEESPEVQGLGIFKGKVVRFCGNHKVPHMGWNSISFAQEKHCPIFKELKSGDYMYFTHSYYVCPEDPDLSIAFTRYGENFVSAIWKGNVFATQFHPEKSQAVGLKVLKSFGELY